MSILQRTRTVATHPTRSSSAKPLPFGDGIEEPTPRPGAYGVTSAPLLAAEPVAVIPDCSALAPAWAAGVRRLLTHYRYGKSDRAAARSWIESRGTIQGCPVISRAHWFSVDAAVNRFARKADPTPVPPPAVAVEVLEQPTPTLEPEPVPAPATKPAPTPRKVRATKTKTKSGKPAPIARDEHRPTVEPFYPDPVDRAWAENNPRDGFETQPAPPFWGRLEAMGRQLRDRGDEVGAFLAAEINRLVQTASLIGAEGLADFDAKRDQADMTARGAYEARGYEAGYAEGLVDGHPHDGCMD